MAVAGQAGTTLTITSGALLFCYSMLRSQYGGDVLAVDVVVY